MYRSTYDCTLTMYSSKLSCTPHCTMDNVQQYTWLYYGHCTAVHLVAPRMMYNIKPGCTLDNVQQYNLQYLQRTYTNTVISTCTSFFLSNRSFVGLCSPAKYLSEFSGPYYAHLSNLHSFNCLQQEDLLFF